EGGGASATSPQRARTSRTTQSPAQDRFLAFTLTTSMPGAPEIRSREASDRLNDLFAVTRFLVQDGTYDHHDIVGWARSRNHHLEQQRPLDLLADPAAFDAVLAAAEVLVRPELVSQKFGEVAVAPVDVGARSSGWPWNVARAAARARAAWRSISCGPRRRTDLRAPKRITEHRLSYFPYAAFTDANLPLRTRSVRRWAPTPEAAVGRALGDLRLRGEVGAGDPGLPEAAVVVAHECHAPAIAGKISARG
ncbi:MAG: hypothetical protein LC790_13070, partial [Actinobacteria bacterium]|nr:hypothetical protein [Actinomycetota bacterium]